MPSDNIHSPAKAAGASPGFFAQVFPDNSEQLAQLAAAQQAALDAYLASPEFARHQDAQAEFFTRLSEQSLVIPRDQDTGEGRGSQQDGTK